MKKLICILPLLLITVIATAQVSMTAQLSRVDASIEVLDDISVVGTYSSQNGLGDYVAVGTKYRKQLDQPLNPVFAVQGQYGIGTYTKPAAQDFLTDQTEFEFAFSYSVFAGVAVKNFDVGLSLNQHLGKNEDIWLSPSISVHF